MAIANIISGVLCTLPCFGALAGESLWLITPHSNPAKLAGRSQIIKIYGAMCGLRHMNYVDGYLAIFMLVPIIVGVWTWSSPIAALVANLCICMSIPFFLLVGLYIALLPLPMGGVGEETPQVFGVFGVLLGGNLTWRTLDPTFLVPTEYVTVVVGWHAVCMLIFAVYAHNFVALTPKLKYTMKHEKMMDDAVNLGGSKWIRGEPMPVGFKPDKKVLKESEKEMTAVVYMPLWRLLLQCALLLGVLVGALLVVPTLSSPLLKDPRWIYASLAMALAGAGFLIYASKAAIKGGFGKREVNALV